MRTLRTIAFAVVIAMTGVAAALAHAKMNASVPKDGETVLAGLSEIQLQFSKPLRLTLIRVRRVQDQKAISVGSELPQSFVDTAKVAIDALEAGSYEVFWTAVAADGHVMMDSFYFSVEQNPNAQTEQ